MNINLIVMKKLFFFLSLFLFVSCEELQGFLERFPEYDGKIVKENLPIATENVGLLEGLYCDSAYIVALDFRDDKSYSLFSTKTGKLLSRFGEIGKGHMEIPIGCEGSIYENSFVIFDDETRFVAAYNLLVDSVNSKCDRIHQYKIDGAQLSQIIPLDNNTFVGMGTYKDCYQYFLFDKFNKVLDFAYEIYNASDNKFNTFGKFLSNQGKLVKHPKEAKFVGATKQSTNIDFFSAENEKIKKIKSLRIGNPSFTQTEVMGMSRIIPTDASINGFIDLCASDNYVFALYSEDKLKVSSYRSNIILVFDWDGNEICKIDMNRYIYYIAVWKSTLYTVEKDEKGRHIIKKYELDKL